jgi:predicted phage terminase large subunit-like protein
VQLLTDAEIEALAANISSFTPEEQAQIAVVIEELERRQQTKRCQDSLIEFCKYMDPTYVVAPHHKRLAELLMQIAYGQKDRIAVSIPPRHGKSHLVSTLFPAWFLGKFPEKKVLMVSHTGDLAVDFGRKVRNIIADARYASIFPGITLAQDSKSAGRWSTNKGGEYYACLRRYTPVQTTRGPIPAGEIRIGDRLLNCGRPVKVLEIYNSSHPQTFRVAGLDCSADHPIWTMNRGWVPASKVSPRDLLRVASIWDRLEALAWRSYGYLEHPCVPSLVQHQEPLHQPQQREMGVVRGARNLFVRTLAKIREFSIRHGRGAFAYAYSGADRQRWAVQPRELSVGNAYRAGEQQTNERTHRREDFSAARSGARNNAGSNSVQNEQGCRPAKSNKTAEEELRTYSDPENLGWLSRLSARLIENCWAESQSVQSRSWTKRYMAGAGRAAQNLCGFLLGVRPAGTVVVTSATPAPFVNFLTDGDHTFFADGVLTHNCGVGAALAGRGADLLLVDDPHSEQDLLTGNFDELEKTYQWFAFGARTRLMSEGRIAVIHCLVGDTSILLADGSTRLLREVRPGDMVAGYREGRLVPARVLNWTSQGFDRVLTIKTTLGKIVQANEKHPFLVDQCGALSWTKVSDLRVGMSLIGVCPPRVTDSNNPQNESVSLPQELKFSAYPSAAKKSATNLNTHLGNANTTTTKIGEKTKLFLDLLTGASGKALGAVSRGVRNLLDQKDSASLTTISSNGPRGTANVARRKTVTRTLSTGMASALQNITACLKNKTVSVQSVGDPQVQTTPLQVGKENSESIIATVESAFAPCCAIHATSLSAKETQRKLSSELLSTYELIHDQIAEITLNGYQEVFDIQVEGTESFIANGLVSHNTRWHQSDLIGHLISDGANNPKADQYEVFEFPAIITTTVKTDEGEKTVEKALWPEKFDLDALERTKASMPVFQWNAQYMQNPTGEQGAILQRDWWRKWERDEPPDCEYIIMALDAAAEKNNRADYTAILTFGVFSDDNLTDGAPHIILLNAINIRVEFPELKDLAIQEWKDWEPDAFIVEKKSSGTPLYQELRRMGIPVQEFVPHRGTGDKIARLNAVADIVRSGMVWYPASRRWAEEVIEQAVAFPYGAHDDMVDCLSMVLSRYRQGGFVQLPSDYRDSELLNRPRRAAYY